MVGRASDGGSRGASSSVVSGQRCGGWHDSKMAIGSSFHVKITKITNCMRSQITNRGSQNFCDLCDRQIVILERTENGMNSRFFVATAPQLDFVAGVFWRQRFVAGALIYVLHRRIAHLFTSCTTTMPTLLRLALSYNTCCEKEGDPLQPSKMIFVPSLVVPPKNSHQPWPFRCLAAAPNPCSTIQQHCTAPFRNTSSRGSANSAVYAVTRGGAIKAGTNHRKHKITTSAS